MRHAAEPVAVVEDGRHGRQQETAEPLEGLVVGAAQRRSSKGLVAVAVAAERGEEEAVLVAEGGVQAAAAETGDGAEVVEARPGVPGLAELPLDSRQHLLPVEAGWACHASRVRRERGS